MDEYFHVLYPHSYLASVSTEMLARAMTILVFSLEPWGDMWYSKQHYAAELAKDHLVYFISPPVRWQLCDLFSLNLKLRTTPEGVTVVDYRNNLPLRLLPLPIARWAIRQTARKLGRLLQSGETVLWCFHPTAIALQIALRRKNTQLIYHVVDPYENFSDDIPCAREADVVVIVNPRYKERYMPINPNTILIPHGVREMDRVRGAREAYKQAKHPYAIMAGGITSRTDYALLQTMCERLPRLRLILAGQMEPLEPELERQRNALLALSNVQYAGVLHPNQLQSLVGAAIVGLIAYGFDPVQGTPLKALNYLAQLRPVVSSINCRIPELEGKGIYHVENAENFIQRVTQAMDGTLQLEEEVVNRYLDDRSYDKLVARILDSLPPLSEQKA